MFTAGCTMVSPNSDRSERMAPSAAGPPSCSTSGPSRKSSSPRIIVYAMPYCIDTRASVISRASHRPVALVSMLPCSAWVISELRTLKYRMNSSRSFQWKSACHTPALGSVTVGKPAANARWPYSMSSHWKNIGNGRPTAAITSDGIRHDHQALYSASTRLCWRCLIMSALCSALGAHRPARSRSICVCSAPTCSSRVFFR